MWCLMLISFMQKHQPVVASPSSPLHVRMWKSFNVLLPVDEQFSFCSDADDLTNLSAEEGAPALTQLLLERLYLPVGSEQLGFPLWTERAI